jgi:hypothetical protein
MTNQSTRINMSYTVLEAKALHEYLLTATPLGWHRTAAHSRAIQRIEKRLAKLLAEAGK